MSQLLRHAKELIGKPSSWTKHKMARRRDDQPCNEDSPNAIKFCALGAVHRAIQDIGLPCGEPVGVLHRVVQKHRLFEDGAEVARGLSDFNDAKDTTHEAIMSLFDDAIVEAERDEAQLAKAQLN